MKKSKLLSVLSLGVIVGVLASCNENDFFGLSRPKRLTEVLGLTANPGEPEVKREEDGEVIILNDPSTDPRLTQASSLKLSVKSKVLFFSANAKNPFNETFKPEVSVLPYTARNTKLVWSSSNSGVASVDATGAIKALSQGTTAITVATEDGKISDSLTIVVNDADVFASDAAVSARNILKVQTSDGFKVPEPFCLEERFVTKDVRGGLVTASTDDLETLTFSQEDAYFRITAEGTETLVEAGSPIPSKVDYIFYTTKDFDTYCLNQLNKHVLIIDQSHLASKGKTRYDALCEVLDSFFVSGSKIVTQLKGDLTGYTLLNEKDYKGAKYVGSLGDNSGEFAYYQEELGKSGRASQSDEEEMGIPVGTKYTVDDKLRYLWQDNLVTAKEINETISFKIGEMDVYYLYDITYQYMTKNIELTYPDVSKYTPVADIFEF